MKKRCKLRTCISLGDVNTPANYNEDLKLEEDHHVTLAPTSKESLRSFVEKGLIESQDQDAKDISFFSEFELTKSPVKPVRMDWIPSEVGTDLSSEDSLVYCESWCQSFHKFFGPGAGVIATEAAGKFYVL